MPVLEFRLQQASQSQFPAGTTEAEEGTKDKDMPPLDILFRQVPEGYEFLGVLFTIIGSLGIMVLLGAWWSR